MNEESTANDRLEDIGVAWNKLKDSDDEDDVQRFLERHVALIPGAFGDIGPNGHHGPLYSGVIRQPPLRGLDAKLIPDFMWITRSTVDVTPICIEIERPTKRWFTAKGVATAQLTEAQDQLARWRAWFREPTNEAVFREQYLKGRFARRALRPQFVLIYGREADFTGPSKRTPDERHAKRIDLAHADEHLLTFDSLGWRAYQEDLLTLSMHDNGQFEVSWIPAGFERLGDPTGAYHLGPIDDALAKNADIDDTRAAEIKRLWTKEQEQGDRLTRGETHLGFKLDHGRLSRP